MCIRDRFDGRVVELLRRGWGSAMLSLSPRASPLGIPRLPVLDLEIISSAGRGNQEQVGGDGQGHEDAQASHR
eukprot:6119967-Pyramimonas_sp.AAC.1